ncbi:MAG: hypothetical protein S4CHLAM37_00930 [Chlamydiia bacterium]|nr:hypothetical protein [Chlamydiia bacterium]
MTLLEIMIVIFIIGIISSVIGYNMKGSLEKAKAFKTKEGIKKINEIFDLEVASGTLLQDVIDDPGAVLKSSGLVSNVKDLLRDGWGKDYAIRMSKSGRSVIIKSDNYDRYQSKQKKKSKNTLALNDDDEVEEDED